MIWLQAFLTLLSLIGVAISLVGFPGIILIFIAVLIAFVDPNLVDISLQDLLIVGLITLLSFFVDNISTLVGARKYGASKWGIIGAFLGGIAGFAIFPPFGIFLGPFIGAVTGELLGNPKNEDVIKSGIGATLGLFMGIFLKFVVTFAVFIWALFLIW